MKKFRLALTLSLVAIFVLASVAFAAPAKKNLSVDLVFGGGRVWNPYSLIKIKALPALPATWTARNVQGNITFERQVSVKRLPFMGINPEKNWYPTQYMGLNAKGGATFLSSTWEKGLCAAGVKFSLDGNGETMKVRVTNPGKYTLMVVGSAGSGTLLPGKTAVFFGKFSSGGLGLITSEGKQCASVTWSIP